MNTKNEDLKCIIVKNTKENHCIMHHLGFLGTKIKELERFLENKDLPNNIRYNLLKRKSYVRNLYNIQKVKVKSISL